MSGYADAATTLPKREKDTQNTREYGGNDTHNVTHAYQNKHWTCESPQNGTQNGWNPTDRSGFSKAVLHKTQKTFCAGMLKCRAFDKPKQGKRTGNILKTEEAKCDGRKQQNKQANQSQTKQRHRHTEEATQNTYTCVALSKYARSKTSHVRQRLTSGLSVRSRHQSKTQLCRNSSQWEAQRHIEIMYL